MRILILKLLFMNPAFSTTDLYTFKSQKTFEKTSKKIEDFIKQKGLKLFAVVDHSQNAKKAGISLEDNRLFIFGNPKVGTPLMKSQATMGIDLPVKVLVYQSKSGVVNVTYNKPSSLSKKHGIAKKHPSFLKMQKALKGLEKFISQ